MKLSKLLMMKCLGWMKKNCSDQLKKSCLVYNETTLFDYLNVEPIKSRNNGCGRLGRDTSSGWN